MCYIPVIPGFGPWILLKPPLLPDLYGLPQGGGMREQQVVVAPVLRERDCGFQEVDGLAG